MACIHVAGFLHETNTFSGVPTGQDAFEHCAYVAGLRRGEAVFGLADGPLAIAGFMRRARADGHDLHPLLYAFAEPSGLVTRDAFERIADELVAAIHAGPRPDAVFLDLHGAMVAEHLDDGEAEILRRVRAAVGDVPVACTLDLHGNIDVETLAGADLAAGYLTYPHVDMAQRGERVAELVDRMLRTGARPAAAHVQLPYLFPDQCQSTDLEPARGLYARAAALEGRPGVWTVSLMAGFYQADVAFAGPSLFVYADDRETAEAVAGELAAAVREAEPRFAGDVLGVGEAADMAAGWTGAGPLILADIQDNPGGGAASDNVELLEALVARRVHDAAVAMICDPAAARIAHACGTGITVRLSLGGKGMPGQAPFTGEFTIGTTNRDPVALEGPLAGLVVDIGLSAALRIGGVQVVVCSKPSQCLDRAYLKVHGIEPERQRVLVLKSAAHYRGDFTHIAGRIVDVATDSGCVSDPTRLRYAKLRRDVRLWGMGPTLGEVEAQAAAGAAAGPG